MFELDGIAVQQRPCQCTCRFPSSRWFRRDTALVVANSVNSDALTASLRNAAPAFVRAVEVFDKTVVPDCRKAKKRCNSGTYARY